jgi:hypothetical protein
MCPERANDVRKSRRSLPGYPSPVLARLHNHNSTKLCEKRLRTSAEGGRVHALLACVIKKIIFGSTIIA